MTYTPKTNQPDSAHAWTFAGLSVDSSGACFAAERRALRDIKPKGLLVRYPNPFTDDGPPEVLYECSDSFQHFWRSPSGEPHILGKKHHFKVKGKFKTKEITQRAQRYVRIRGFGDRLLLALGWPTAYLEIVGDEHRPLDVGLTEHCEAIDGTNPDDIYITSSEGIAHFDGTSWRRLTQPTRALLACVSRDEVYCTGIDPEQGLVFDVYRGNARDGFVGVVPAKSQHSFAHILHALRDIYLVKTGEESGLYRVDGSAIEYVVKANGYTGRAAGTRDVLWFENGIELLCFDGKTWKHVPRVWQETTK